MTSRRGGRALTAATGLTPVLAVLSVLATVATTVLGVVLLAGGLSLTASAATRGPAAAQGGAAAATTSTAVPTVTATPSTEVPSAVAMPVDASGSNPLAGHTWGVYAGPYEQWYQPWLASTGDQRTLLDTIALQPKSSWFGSWITPDRIGANLADYIATSQQGDPDAMVQLTIFGIKPWGPTGACEKGISAAQSATYKSWVTQAAQAVGSTYAAIVIQPDSPFTTQCAPKPKQALRLIRYATRAFAALPRTSVYVEAGADDWLHGDVSSALKILVPGGVQYARGFAFNGTHYDATSANIEFGAKIARALAKRGMPGKHMVINTAQNGAPFTGAEYGGNFPDNARVCKSADPGRQRLCVTLGIPPTTDVADPRWGLSAHDAHLAAKYVDAYLWFGRPWLKDQASPFVMSRALRLAATTPFH